MPVAPWKEYCAYLGALIFAVLASFDGAALGYYLGGIALGMMFGWFLVTKALYAKMLRRGNTEKYASEFLLGKD